MRGNERPVHIHPWLEIGLDEVHPVWMKVVAVSDALELMLARDVFSSRTVVVFEFFVSNCAVGSLPVNAASKKKILSEKKNQFLPRWWSSFGQKKLHSPFRNPWEIVSDGAPIGIEARLPKSWRNTVQNFLFDAIVDSCRSSNIESCAANIVCKAGEMHYGCFS